LFVESNLFAIDIVQMIGTYKEDGKQYLVLEYLPKGDVLSLLVDKHGKKLELSDKLDLIIGAARGMEYLEQEKVIHNDLGLLHLLWKLLLILWIRSAARNLLVFKMDDKYSVKVTDFGLSKNTEHYTSSQRQIPIRWSAPEVLKVMIWLDYTNIIVIVRTIFFKIRCVQVCDEYELLHWFFSSFGVTMYEILSGGLMPFVELSTSDVANLVVSGKAKLPKPDGCPHELYELMLKCMAYDADERPTFKQVISTHSFITDISISDLCWTQQVCQRGRNWAQTKRKRYWRGTRERSTIHALTL
jgi:serine/threonine protein kinase